MLWLRPEQPPPVMPSRRPPALGAMPSLAMATRMRLRARTVSWMDLASGDCASESAVRTGDGGAAATVGAATAPFGVSVWRVTKDMVRAFYRAFSAGLQPAVLRRHLNLGRCPRLE